MSGIFKQLARMNIEWKKVHIFMVDERLVPIEHKDSNFRLAYDSFLSKLIMDGLLPGTNVHPFIYDETLAEKGTEDYQDELMSLGGKFNIVLLSSGEDGHIGALYPDHSSLKNDDEYFITMHDSPKPPKNRMTMSRKLFLRSDRVLILFLGKGKQEALDRFMDKSVKTKECPAKLAQLIQKSYMLTDQ